ncbi:MAG: ECF transporter S component [Erysipelotrichaceae bacterium]|nr:ECF transporter S component [Erysipelotrichaceae bacterium]
MKKVLTVKNITMIAVLGALGAVLMLFDFPIMIAPGFYKLDLGDLPCLIGAFALGPVPALLIQVVKILIKLLLKPTSTAFVGEIAAFIFSSVYCVSASLVYQADRTKKGAMKALIVASVLMSVFAAFGNYAFIIPAYVNMYHMPLEAIVAMGTKIFPVIHDKFSFVLCCVLPFNLVKAIIVDVLTIILYKHISPLLKR